MFRLILGILFVGVFTAWVVLAGLLLWVPDKKTEWDPNVLSRITGTPEPSAWQVTAVEWSDWVVGAEGDIPGSVIAGVPLAIATFALFWMYLKLRKRKKRKEQDEKD